MTVALEHETTRAIPDGAVVIGPEAYLSEAYARAENELLWGKVWQVACRVEEIPKVGDYVTYDILDDSIIVVRVAADRIAAYHNVCAHRGRRLTDGCGHTKRFACRFHGWKWNLDGTNAEVICREEWGDALNDDYLRLQEVKADIWGGYVFINMDLGCEPLSAFLAPAAAMLDPFELDKMRYRWRQWLHVPCNWKVAIEAFMEGYHVLGTHPQLTRHGGAKLTWTRGYGKHSAFGTRDQKGFGGGTAGSAGAADLRKAAAESLNELWETVNATTTETIVKAANRLVDELPEGTPPDKVMMHLMMSAMQDDAARGVVWPRVDPSHIREAGAGWSIFPNTMILQGLTFALCYRARPHGYDPDSCIFEVYVIERFPEGQEPKTENVYQTELTEETWRKVLMQDFGNMSEVHRGMKSRAFRGARPNPLQEQSVVNFHKTLASYMGTGAPVPIT
jgi:phenylpropionate dioxygenase-like ring-hydroxylating dioxygenase large terminal subunit